MIFLDSNTDLDDEYFYENQVLNPNDPHRNNFGPFLDPTLKPAIGSLPGNNLVIEN